MQDYPSLRDTPTRTPKTSRQNFETATPLIQMHCSSQGERPPEEFISEPIEPVPGTALVTAMTRREPGLPGRFVWRDGEYEVAEVLEQWKQADARDGGEKYVRKHWYRVRTTAGEVMTLYFLRQTRSPSTKKNRWCLYSIETNGLPSS